jgi:hypothetical protein
MKVLQSRVPHRDLVFGIGQDGYAAGREARRRSTGTAGTGMADIGQLNHVSGHKADGAGIYNRSNYATEKRAAPDGGRAIFRLS